LILSPLWRFTALAVKVALPKVILPGLTLSKHVNFSKYRTKNNCEAIKKYQF
jgi:hypothetical protein